LSLRAVTLPLARASAAVSAAWSAALAAVTIASVGTGDGNSALAVIAATMLCAYVMMAMMIFGILTTASERLPDLLGVMGISLFVLRVVVFHREFDRLDSSPARFRLVLLLFRSAPFSFRLNPFRSSWCLFQLVSIPLLLRLDSGSFRKEVVLIGLNPDRFRRDEDRLRVDPDRIRPKPHHF
jgi:hypothetical protein